MNSTFASQRQRETAIPAHAMASWLPVSTSFFSLSISLLKGTVSQLVGLASDSANALRQMLCRH